MKYNDLRNQCKSMRKIKNGDAIATSRGHQKSLNRNGMWLKPAVWVVRSAATQFEDALCLFCRLGLEVHCLRFEIIIGRSVGEAQMAVEIVVVSMHLSNCKPINGDAYDSLSSGQLSNWFINSRPVEKDKNMRKLKWKENINSLPRSKITSKYWLVHKFISFAALNDRQQERQAAPYDPLTSTRCPLALWTLTLSWCCIEIKWELSNAYSTDCRWFLRWKMKMEKKCSDLSTSKLTCAVPFSCWRHWCWRDWTLDRRFRPLLSFAF